MKEENSKIKEPKQDDEKTFEERVIEKMKQKLNIKSEV